MRDLTKGSPAKLILMFTVPLLIGNVFQQFYNMVDMIIVGQTLGKNALAAVGATGSLTFLILGFAQGLTAGLAIIHHRHWRHRPSSCVEQFRNRCRSRSSSSQQN